jgi:tetratricopeptide (TPR) repeat protein
MTTTLPPPARKELERAVQLSRDGRLATAEDICIELLARFPADPEVTHFSGVLANRMGRYEIAIQRLTRCVQADPRRARALAALGLAHEQLGHSDAARDSFALAVRADPSFAEAHNGLGVALFRAGRVREAIESFDRALALDPASAETRLNRARALHALGLDAAAARSWREALSLAPRRDDVVRICAVGLLESGERAAGIAAMQGFLERVPDDAVARSQLALALDAEGRTDEAFGEMQRALEGNAPSRVHNASGTLSMRKGRWTEALASFEAALAADPSADDVKVNAALVLRELGRREEAFARMREASASRDARVLNQLAAMHGQLGESDLAVATAGRAIAEAPALAEAHTTLSVELLRRGELERGWREHVFRPTRGSAIFEEVQQGRYPPAMPRELRGADIVVRAEQGLGDVLFFLRYAMPLHAAGARLHVLKADPRLKPILQRSFPANVVDSDADLPAGATALWIGDLPMFVRPLTGRDVEPMFPLVPLADRVAALREKLGDGAPLAGLAWRAGTAPRTGLVGQKLLSKEVAPALLAAALAALPYRWVSIQRRPGEGETAEMERALGAPLLDFSAANEDLEDILALMSLLDEYVGVSSTNVHLRAGVGRGGRVLVPFPADWRWQAARASPWFPGFATYREDREAGWGGALAELRAGLERGS